MNRVSLLGLAGAVLAGFAAGWGAATLAGKAGGGGARGESAATVREEGARRPDRVESGPATVTRASVSALGELLSFPAPESPEFARRLREIFADPLAGRRLSRLQLALEKFTTEQFAAMVPLIRENDLRGVGSGKEWETLWQNWAKADGAGAIDFLDSFDWAEWHPLAAPGARYNAMIGWGASHPEDALAYLETRGEEGGQGGDLFHAMFQGWIGRDVDAAAHWLLQDTSGARDGRACQAVVDAICRQGGQPLLETWFAGLPKDNLGAFQQIASAVTVAKGRFEPAAAQAWLEQQRGQPWLEGSDLLPSTARRMARDDPAAAMEWAGRMQSAPSADQVMQEWFRQDPWSASQWLADHPDSPQYDAAARRLSLLLSREDPEAARRWAETIKDPALRAGTLGEGAH